MANTSTKHIETSTYSGVDRRNGADLWPLPLWIRAVAVVGIPGAIAIFLTWVGANEVPRIKTQVQSTYDEVLRNREIIREHTEQSAAMYRMLQRICSNTAKSDDERQRCFDR